MLFNSVVFIFAFFPLVVFVFFRIARRNHLLAAGWLVFASLFFYGWWNPRYVLLLMGRAYRPGSESKRRSQRLATAGPAQQAPNFGELRRVAAPVVVAIATHLFQPKFHVLRR